ncbi:hypothetical protein O0I10_003663 [Lichtheimia ornata]|uniref:Alpha-and gamma-adaptin-binding protein p34 n=1 Tax=Lichtheimia ornata TaxID=688661 RepID=A0AAD7V978_9FUNG|nr:uncharacterized protein O0I10_003663 [Lichtheimia ornata]KAJ8660615.1 hypothetical protein O0I10_003663 [Lichtheimia ornata]
MDRVLRNKILVVGTGVLDFVRGVFKSCQLDFPQKLVDDELKKSNGSHSGIRIPWKITTKYYVASVDFWLDEMASDVDHKEVIKGYTDPDNGVGQVVDAFVYVFHKDNVKSFEGVKDWISFLDKYEPSIRLCAALPFKEEKKQDFEDIEEWCLDHQFEYVDMDEKTVEPLDKGGWDLAVDILQTNLWDGMKEHKSSHDKDDEQAADEELLRELQMLKLENERDQGEADMPSQSEINEMQKLLFNDLDKEDGLDKAFETMQALREQGKDLPDEERRKLAAKVALSFAAQLGV